MTQSEKDEDQLSVRGGDRAEHSLAAVLWINDDDKRGAAVQHQQLRRAPVSRSWNLIQDPEFTSANSVFKGVVKEIRGAGRDKTAHHPPISPEDPRILKHSASLSPDSPKGLLNKVWYDVQIHLDAGAKKETGV